jgi:hypothetical protein
MGYVSYKVAVQRNSMLNYILDVCLFNELHYINKLRHKYCEDLRPPYLFQRGRHVGRATHSGYYQAALACNRAWLR